MCFVLVYYVLASFEIFEKNDQNTPVDIPSNDCLPGHRGGCHGLEGVPGRDIQVYPLC
ncbi:Uncharacterized protein TCM_014327 [Theobroma cacao]|uniref:Uncharacterized protein n=1 Tax=Theobroma cacao TaxID=3641 RepID=A0A061FZ20_THECC|nr:Uncharacterized protein TCM_014327 [Theobroma cacao]